MIDRNKILVGNQSSIPIRDDRSPGQWVPFPQTVEAKHLVAAPVLLSVFGHASILAAFEAPLTPIPLIKPITARGSLAPLLIAALLQTGAVNSLSKEPTYLPSSLVAPLAARIIPGSKFNATSLRDVLALRTQQVGLRSSALVLNAVPSQSKRDTYLKLIKLLDSFRLSQGGHTGNLVVSQAIVILNALSGEELPQIVPARDGSLLFFWHNLANHVELNILEDGHIVWFGKLNNEYVPGDDVAWHQTIPHDLRKMLQAL